MHSKNIKQYNQIHLMGGNKSRKSESILLHNHPRFFIYLFQTLQCNIEFSRECLSLVIMTPKYILKVHVKVVVANISKMLYLGLTYRRLLLKAEHGVHEHTWLLNILGNRSFFS